LRTFFLRVKVYEGNDEWWDGHPEYIGHVPLGEDVREAIAYELGNWHVEVELERVEDEEGNAFLPGFEPAIPSVYDEQEEEWG
jgi:hypothetical protein